MLKGSQEFVSPRNYSEKTDRSLFICNDFNTEKENDDEQV